MSPLLYVLVVEALACNIRANPSIRGLCLPGFSAPLPCVSLYADDTSLIVCSDVWILAIFSVFSYYEQGSGAKLNYSKCKGFWLGSWADRTDPPVDIEWSSEMVKILGVFVGPGNVEEAN